MNSNLNYLLFHICHAASSSGFFQDFFHCPWFSSFWLWSLCGFLWVFPIQDSLTFSEHICLCLSLSWENLRHYFVFCTTFILFSIWYSDNTNIKLFGIVLSFPETLFLFFSSFFFSLLIKLDSLYWFMFKYTDFFFWNLHSATESTNWTFYFGYCSFSF